MILDFVSWKCQYNFDALSKTIYTRMKSEILIFFKGVA